MSARGAAVSGVHMMERLVLLTLFCYTHTVVTWIFLEAKVGLGQVPCVVFESLIYWASLPLKIPIADRHASASP